MNKFHSEFVWVPREAAPNVGNEGKKEEEWKWKWGGKRDACEVRQGESFADDERFVCVFCLLKVFRLDCDRFGFVGKRESSATDDAIDEPCALGLQTRQLPRVKDGSDSSTETDSQETSFSSSEC